VQDQLFEQVLQYVFGGLFVVLFLYVLQTSRRREDRLLRHAEKLQEAFQETAETMKIMKSEMSQDLREIKHTLEIRGRRKNDN